MERNVVVEEAKKRCRVVCDEIQALSLSNITDSCKRTLLRLVNSELKFLTRTSSNSNSIIRNPPLWGTMKYLSEKIPKDSSSKVRINRDLYSHEKIMETAPPLPDFALALKPDEYHLPPVDRSWNEENPKVQSSSNQVKSERT